ncbi:MAG: efflux RND transporter periplasmic adaptor subunit [Candidatus Latescibacteria bacterium]|nr:efflux RND transporter periplasmic adaptor subunit [Candidatus Latescibacterota bacterium]
MATKKRRLLKVLVFLLLAGSVGAAVYFNLRQEKAEETYPTALVEQGAVVDKLAETGRIELVRIAGEIRDLPIEAGAWVETGELMAVIEPDPNQSLQLYQKRSRVEQGKIDLAEQERNFERQKALFESKMIPAKQFEEAEVRLTRARTSLRLAQLELDMLEAKANLQRTQLSEDQVSLDEVRVLAPIDGIVIRRNVEIGEVVASGLSSYSGGTMLFAIGDPSQMIVRGDIAEIDIGRVQVGQDVDIIVDAYPDTTYGGRVRWIAPVGQRKQGSTIVTFDTEIEITDHAPRLRQGMSCDIDILFARRDSAVYLPVERALEVFDEEDEGDEREGTRGRFVAYIAQSPDSLVAAPDSTRSDSTRPDSALQLPLSAFAEVTSTRLEILSGLASGDRVAEDPSIIRSELEQKDEEQDEDGEKE